MDPNTEPNRNPTPDPTPDPPGDRVPAGPPATIPERWAFGELLALSGLAVTQPLLDIFGRAPDHFIFRGVDGVAIIAFGLLVTLAVPLAAYGLERLVGLFGSSARRQTHELLLGLLVAAFTTLLVDGILERIPALVTGLLVAAVFVLLLQRTRGTRIWIRFLVPAPIIFLAVFLLASPVAPLIRGSASTHDVHIGRPTPTIVVLLDEFPLVTLLDENGDVDRDLFPNFARLADSSHWYRQATTVSNTTTIAVPSLLTGKLPQSKKSPDASSFPDNLFTLVAGSMPVTSSEVITRMCPASVCEHIEVRTGGFGALLTDARDVLAQRLSPTEPERDPMSQLVEDPRAGVKPEGADELWSRAPDGGVDRFERFVDSLEADVGLHFLHLLLPHGPYRLLPDGTGYPWLDPGLGRSFDNWTPDAEPVTVARQQFLLQLQWTDHLLGQLLDRLVDTGLWDEANLVLLADHGYGFEPGGTFRARTARDGEDERTIAEITWIPFFVRTAGQTDGTVSDDPVRIVDLLPTIADLLEIDIPWTIDGRSTFDGGSGHPDEIGLYRTIGGALPGDEAHRSFDRDRAHRLLMERTTGAFAPAGPDRTGSDRIFAVGPRPDLVGRPVPDGLPEVEMNLHEDSRADDVDPSSGIVPALLRAEVPDLPAGTTVAVAVNRTIRATTRTYGTAPTSVAAILPADAFHEGANTITLHLLDQP